MKTDLQSELIATLLLDINKLVSTLMKLIPDEVKFKDCLKHLAASHIHIGMFAFDLFNVDDVHTSEIDNLLVKRFLKDCGCDMEKIK